MKLSVSEAVFLAEKVSEDERIFLTKEILQKFYDFLEIFFSGYFVLTTDDANSLYLFFCEFLENFVPKFGGFWKRPFQSLADLRDEDPEVDWEYGGRDLVKSIISSFDRSVEIHKKPSLSKESRFILEEIDKEISSYRFFKEENEKFLEEAVLGGKDLKGEDLEDLFKKMELHPHIRSICERAFLSKRFNLAVSSVYSFIKSVISKRIEKIEDLTPPELIYKSLLKKEFSKEKRSILLGLSHIIFGMELAFSNPCKKGYILISDHMECAKIISFMDYIYRNLEKIVL